MSTLQPLCLMCRGEKKVLTVPSFTMAVCPRCEGSGLHTSEYRLRPGTVVPVRHRRRSRWNRILRKLGVR